MRERERGGEGGEGERVEGEGEEEGERKRWRDDILIFSLSLKVMGHPAAEGVRMVAVTQPLCSNNFWLFYQQTTPLREVRWGGSYLRLQDCLAMFRAA